jgi:tRNA dimethylallyltransferase
VTSALACFRNDRILALAGPTAAGKSEVALVLAEKLNGEIISVDSMQVYRGLDIGTAKPSPGDRARVPHQLIDVVDLTTPFDAAQFVRRANEAIEAVRRREKLSILCGGTGLYFKALFEGLGQAPAGAPELRAALEAMPLPELLHELEQRDPLTYQRIDRQNPRRVIRALEVICTTNKPYSLQRADWSQPSREPRNLPFFGLLRSSADLHLRIEARVDAMFRQGLVSETEALLRSGLAKNRAALQALGYRQTVEYLQGVRSLCETIALVKTRTRQFAKRQMTWFRRQLPVRWIEVGPEQPAHQIAGKIYDEFITTFGA